MTTSARIDLWDLTARQHGALSLDDLRAAGLSRAAIAHRVARHRLWPLFGRRVFAVGRPRLDKLGHWRAATLAVAHHWDHAVPLSALSALALWGLRDQRAGETIHVSVPTQSGVRSPKGLTVHRARTLTADDVEWRSGIPVTSLWRTLLDVALLLDERELKRVVRRAEYLHGLDVAALRRSLDGVGSSPAHGRLRRLLDEWVPGIGLTEVDIEATVMELCAAAELPLPVPQRRFGRVRPDFVWEEFRLILEIDEPRGHGGWLAGQLDREKDRMMDRNGYSVLRFTVGEIREQPTKFVSELRASINRRRLAA